MVKKVDKTAAANAAQKLPAGEAGAATREAMSDDAKGWDEAQAKSMAGTAKYGDRARVDGKDVWWDGDGWSKGSPPEKKATGWGIAHPNPDHAANTAKQEAIPAIGATRRNEALNQDETFNGEAWVKAEPAPIGWGLDGHQVKGGQSTEAKAAKPKRKTKAEKEAEAETDRGVNLSAMQRDLIAGVEKIERLNEEISALKDDAGELFGELKAKGYSTSTIRKAIVRRAMDPEKRKEADDLLALYEEALG